MEWLCETAKNFVNNFFATNLIFRIEYIRMELHFWEWELWDWIIFWTELIFWDWIVFGTVLFFGTKLFLVLNYFLQIWIITICCLRDRFNLLHLRRVIWMVFPYDVWPITYFFKCDIIFFGQLVGLCLDIFEKLQHMVSYCRLNANCHGTYLLKS